MRIRLIYLNIRCSVKLQRQYYRDNNIAEITSRFISYHINNLARHCYLNIYYLKDQLLDNNNLFASCTNASTRQYSFGNITQQTACIMEYITSQKDGIILKYKSFSFQKELETTEKIIWRCLEYTIKKMPQTGRLH